jgi:hypothetical protein
MSEVKPIKWSVIPGYEGLYEVSDEGVVRSLPRVERCGTNTRKREGRVLRQFTDKDGYPQVRLSRDGKAKTTRVSRIVLEAFVGPGHGVEAAHKNHCVQDNRLSNLEWATRLVNEQQKDMAGRRPTVPWLLLTPERMQEVKRMRADGATQKQIGAALGCHHSTVSLALRRSA